MAVKSTADAAAAKAAAMEAEAAAMEAEAAAMEAEAAAAEATAEAVVEDDPARLVKVKLYRGKRDGKGVFVSVNNHRYFVPRGETVELPYFIAEVLRNSEDQDERTALLIEALGQNSGF